jgi:hypothetical protein
VALHDDELVEVKSTALMYDRKRKGVFMPTLAELTGDDPGEYGFPQPQYFLQAAAYAHGYGKSKASVFLVDRGTGIFDDYPVDLDRWYAVFQERAILLTGELQQPTPPERFYPEWTEKKNKPYSYLCVGCPVATCPKWSLAN